MSTQIHQIVNEKLREDLGGTLTSRGFKVGDVCVEVKREYGNYRAWDNTMKVGITVDYRYHQRGSYFKYVTVQPEQQAEYMEKAYPELLAKVKVAIAKLQSAVDVYEEGERKRRDVYEQHQTKIQEFIEAENLEEVLNRQHYASPKYWQSKDGNLEFELYADGTFDLDKCRVRLSLEQVKQIISIVEANQ